MSKNDDRILELKKQIDEKKSEVYKKKSKFIPETNCILNLDGMTYNLNVCQEDFLRLLLVKLNSYLVSAIDLEIPDAMLSGYRIDEWIKDIKSKLELSRLKKEETELKKMESRLNKLLSEDKKTELEIDEIAAILR